MVGVPVSNLLRQWPIGGLATSAAYDDDDVQQPTTARPKVITQVVEWS